MVDVIGHLGMALIWLAPSWFVFQRSRTAAAFVGASFWFGMLPDVDLVLSYLTGIHHHGVFHTVAMVSILSLVIGPVVGFVVVRALEKTGPLDRTVDRHGAMLGVGGVWIAGISHLFADMLSAPDVAQAIEPFWPLSNHQVVVMDVLWYKSLVATVGLFLLGLVLNVGLWYWKRNGERGQPAGRYSSR